MTDTLTLAAGPAVLVRTLAEGYGPGAWHGADFKAAIADITENTAFRRPGPERHNIAEIALHHAFCVHNVRAKLSGTTPEPFVLEGEDWFVLEAGAPLTWARVAALVEAEQRQLADVVAGQGATKPSSLTDTERFDLVLGITCHAVYHAGQVQLVKKLIG